MPPELHISVADTIAANWIVVVALAVAATASVRRKRGSEIMPLAVSAELKGIGALAVVFGHVGYFLVDDHRFLWPLSVASGLGVDLFLFLSGYGLTVGMLRRPIPAATFYQQRVVKLLVPFWLILSGFFIVDALLLDRIYSATYILRSLLGFFPSADMAADVNSPLWYMSWILFYYLLFPVLFMRTRPWLTAILLFMAGELVIAASPIWFAEVIRLYEIHTIAFPLGVLAAWALYAPGSDSQPLRTILQRKRENLGALEHTLTLVSLATICGYLALNSGVNQGRWIEQSINVVILLALLTLFCLKNFHIRLFDCVGKYSYEIYLLHWPLLSRYDVFFKALPAWTSMLAYLLCFFALGRAVQKVTAPVSEALKPANH